MHQLGEVEALKRGSHVAGVCFDLRTLGRVGVDALKGRPEPAFNGCILLGVVFLRQRMATTVGSRVMQDKARWVGSQMRLGSKLNGGIRRINVQHLIVVMRAVIFIVVELRAHLLLQVILGLVDLLL